MFKIAGGAPLEGKVKVNGAKNAALPALAACLLADEPSTLHRVTPAEDIRCMGLLLSYLGAVVRIEDRDSGENSWTIEPAGLFRHGAPFQLVSRMRASFLILGPLLARLGRARIHLPGGCAIGTRPIDLHLKALAALGARISIGDGLVSAETNGLKGALIRLDFPSVGATENTMMASCLARGITTIENAAEEPEIVDLARLLITMGAKIDGAGTKRIQVEGVDRLSGTDHILPADRIEAGTFLAAAVATRGRITVEGVDPSKLTAALLKMSEMGVEVEEGPDWIRVDARSRPRAVHLITQPYPGFPTDLQPQFTAVLSTSQGLGRITEQVFEDRFGHARELERMGARIRLDGRTARIRGVSRLTGTQVSAADLRGGAALVIAGLGAEGLTEVRGVRHIDRGYVNLEGRLASLGACIERRWS
ncbi:MAG: UDP-N-acetylglucosamine 1-carboxyvinyltransferase [Firmicutes bacterium]|nr:UDP-N-acetylglucosamine 1-carboxyvinyltransferase [Bacillota bacterium]